MKFKKWIKVLLPLAIILFIVIALVFGNKQSASEVNYVTTVEVVTEDVEAYVNVSGVILSNKSFDVYSKGTGEVIDINVVEGDTVTKGQLLCVLDSSDIERQIAETEIQLAIAKENLVQIVNSGSNNYKTSYKNALLSKDNAYKEYMNAKTLFEAGVYSQSQVDASYTAYISASNSYDEMRSKYNNESSASEIKIQELRIESYENALRNQKDQLEDMKILSPIDGVITNMNVKLMSYVSPGTPIFMVEDLDDLKVEVNISQYDIHKIALGQVVKIEIEGLEGVSYEGVVSHIGSRAVTKVLRSSQEMVIEVDVDINGEDFNVKPNYTAKVEIETASEKDAMVLPYEAVFINKEGEKIIYTVENNKAKAHTIERGVEGMFTFVVLSDTIQVSDKVILNPTEKITEGVDVVVTGDRHD